MKALSGGCADCVLARKAAQQTAFMCTRTSVILERRMRNMDVILKDGSRGEQEFSDKDGARTFRHTTSHILAQAVMRL